MYPLICEIGPVTIYSYGASLALAFVVCIFLAKREAGRFGLQAELILDLSFWLLVSGLIGARILYCLLNLQLFLENPLEILMIHRGGLVWYGGLITATVFGIIYVKRRGASVLAVMDFIAPYIALGQAIGRLGCFLNGCCFGKLSETLGIYFPVHQAKLIPTQIYSSGLLFIIFFILKWFRGRSHEQGIIFAYYVLLCTTARFFIEFIRGDSAAVIFNLTVFQIISLFLILISGYAIIYIRSKKGR